MPTGVDLLNTGIASCDPPEARLASHTYTHLASSGVSSAHTRCTTTLNFQIHAFCRQHLWRYPHWNDNWATVRSPDSLRLFAAMVLISPLVNMAGQLANALAIFALSPKTGGG